VALGLFTVVPVLGALLALPGIGAERVHWTVWLALAANGAALALLAMLYIYAFPLLALHDIGAGAALRNALVLASRHLWNTLGLLSMGVLFLMAVLFLNSGLAFFLPTVWGAFLVNNCRMVVTEELAAGPQDRARR
jgi:uncharacterized membrane protein YesL